MYYDLTDLVTRCFCFEGLKWSNEGKYFLLDDENQNFFDINISDRFGCLT